MTAGIFLFVFLVIWLVQRHRKRQMAAHAAQIERGHRGGRSTVDQVEDQVVAQHAKKQYNPPTEEQYYPPAEKPYEAQAFHQKSIARVESGTGREDIPAVPPQQVSADGSPVDPNVLPARTLYPSNPSPHASPLQTQPQNRFSVAQPPAQLWNNHHQPRQTAPPTAPPSAMRQTTYSSRPARTSVASVHFGDSTPDVSPVPPMPAYTRPPTTRSISDLDRDRQETLGGTGTVPLSIRKSTVASRAQSTAIPSYYESIQSTVQSTYGEHEMIRPVVRQSVARRSARSVYSTSSNEGSPPPLPPYASRPNLAESGRRPSASPPGGIRVEVGMGQRSPSAGVRKGSEDRGGLI